MTNKLDEFLKEQELTQTKFASMIGVKQASVSRYLSGEQIPEPDVMSEIMKVTDGKIMPNDFYNLPDNLQ